MFSQSLFALGAVALATLTSAKPVPAFKDVVDKRGHGHSFNGFGGFSSMNDFDNFYGADDFSGSSQTLVKTKKVVCHDEKVEIVQQHLAVIREWYKKIITEQICQVEVQSIVHNQWLSGCQSFGNDLRRHGKHRDVSYDYKIASQIVDIHDSNNECVTNDLGWSGDIVGQNACDYSGDNWNVQLSPPVVSSIYSSCQQSYGYSSPMYSQYWGSYSPSYSYGSNYYSTYVAPPSYTYVAPPTYTYSPPSYNYGYGYSSDPAPYVYTTSESDYYTYQAPPPTYTSASYGYGYSAPSYEPSYGSSGYGSSYGSTYGSSYGSSYGSGYSSPDVSSNVTCDSCDVAPPTNVTCDSCGDDSVPTPTSVVVPTDAAAVPSSAAAPTATDDSTDATDATASATDSSNDAASSPAAASTGAAGASIVASGTTAAPSSA